MFTIRTMRLPIDKVKNLDYYNHINETYYTSASYPKLIRYIQEEISSNVPKEKREQMINDYLKTAYNISDHYFEEDYNAEVNNNKGKIVDVGNINVYQKKLGKLVSR